MNAEEFKRELSKLKKEDLNSIILKWLKQIAQYEDKKICPKCHALIDFHNDDDFKCCSQCNKAELCPVHCFINIS